jgi:molybdopterin synthase sulfur carrier subunit
MITVEFLGPIGRKPLPLDVESLAELSELLKEDASLIPWIENSAVAINDVIVNDKSTKLKHGDKVSLLPPVCGG